MIAGHELKQIIGIWNVNITKTKLQQNPMPRTVSNLHISGSSMCRKNIGDDVSTPCYRSRNGYVSKAADAESMVERQMHAVYQQQTVDVTPKKPMQTIDPPKLMQNMCKDQIKSQIPYFKSSLDLIFICSSE
jgi:hypothetical protein